MEQTKNKMIARLKHFLLEQGAEVGEDFERKVSNLSTTQLAIETSLVQAGI